MKIIACLGYKLDPGGKINSILKNRLEDVSGLVSENSKIVVILMGKSTFLDNNASSEAEMMEKYLKQEHSEKFINVEIIKEENSTSAVEQVCILRELIRSADAKYKDAYLVIVSSEVFSERIKMYVEYIFGSIDDVEFIPSNVPEENRLEFIDIETKKLEETKEWLSGHKKGDFEQILKEQKLFEEKIKNGAISYP